MRNVLRGPALQAKLKVGPSDDVYEREADRVAGEVMRMPDPSTQFSSDHGSAQASTNSPEPSIQRACPACEEEQRMQRQEEEEVSLQLQRQAVPEEEPAEALQAKSLTEAQPRIQRVCPECERERLQRQEEEEGDSLQLQRKSLPSNELEDLVQSKGLSVREPRIQRLCPQCEQERLQRQSLPEEEREAVLRTKPLPSSEPRIQRLCPQCENERMQRQEEEEGDSLQLQRKSLPPNELEDVLQNKLESGRMSRVQRRCAQCEEESVRRQAEEDDLRLSSRSQPASEREEEVAQLQASRPAGEGDASSVAPDVESGIRSLRGGGRPLGHSERGFFESRFQRDFSSVRIHDGSRAAELAASVNARAFTLGRDIVFGRGQYSPSTSAGRTLMAHELTHVLQQNRSILRSKPAWSEDRSSMSGAPGPSSSASPDQLQPKLYWEPADMTGTKTHAAVLGRIRDQNSGNIFLESPIPHATKEGSGKGFKYGFADLMQVSGHGKRAFGVRFTDRGKPVPIPGPVAKFNKGYKHSRSAPRVNDAGELVNIGLGATTVKIADLKPRPANPSGTRGKKQIQNYHNGLKYARDRSNKIANKKGTAEWDLQDSNLQFWTDIKIPEKLTGAQFQNRQLVVKDFTWTQGPNGKQSWKPSRAVYTPPKSVRGFLKLNKANNGIVQYRWAPSFPFSPATLTAAVKKMSQKEVEPLLMDLHTIEVKKLQPKFLRPAVGATLRPRARIQRKKPNPKVNTKVADTFDLKEWNKKRKDLNKKYDPLRSQSAVQERRTARYLIDLDKDAGNPDGFASESAIAADRENIKLVKKLDLWTDTRKSAPVSILGKLRKTFGKTFVAISNRIHSIRSKIQKQLKKRRSKPKPNSYGAVAILAIWRAATTILTPVFRSTMAALAESLRLGVKSRLEPKIKVLIDPDKLLAAAQAKASGGAAENFPELAQLQNKVETVQATVGDKVEEFLKSFGSELDQLKKLSDKARTVGKIIKVAMVAVQCATPPLWGCLKLLASTAIARLADRVMKWCSIRKKFQEMALGVSFLKKLPKTLATTFLNAMPADIQEYFDRGPIDALADAIPVEPEKCNEKGHRNGRRQPTPEQQAWAELLSEMGCEENRKSAGCAKFRALMDLMIKRDVNAKAMTADQIRALAPLLKNDDITAKDLRKLRKFLEAGTKISPSQFVEDLPQQLEEAQGRKQRKEAFGAFFKSEGQAKRSLEVGESLLDSSQLTVKVLSSGKAKGVAIVVRASEDSFVGGRTDLTFTGKVRCQGETKVLVPTRLSNVHLADAQGKPIDLGFENLKTEMQTYGSKKIMKPYIEKFCP